MKSQPVFYALSLFILAAFLSFPGLLRAEQVPEITFDHTHTSTETLAYLEKITAAFPDLARLHRIGKSYQGKDLLVLEITNQATGKGRDKPGFWIDGCMHSSETAGGEMSLHTIQTLIRQYGKDPFITRILDERTFYIMPKLNPDGSDYAIHLKSGRDRGGLVQRVRYEHITMMRIRDDNGPMRTSPEDPRLMIPAAHGNNPAQWKGEWRVLQEGIDNDNDGLFNEDGIGGIDINRNFPEQWQPAPLSYNPGPYPLSEQESRAVADYLLSLKNLSGSINYHQTGNVAVFPPSNLRTDPITGDVVRQPYEDELMYQRLGRKCIELNDTARVQVFKIHGASPATWHGSIWGVYVDWIYYRLNAYSWIFEFGINPGAKEIFPSGGKDIDRLRWSDENMDGRLFVDWKPFDHPTLGKVEIGGFLWKLFDETSKTYTNIQCLPGPEWEKTLDNHTRWHLYLIDQSPLLRITDAKVQTEENGYHTITATIENLGVLPTYNTKQGLAGGSAKTVTASISLTGAELVGGEEKVDLGHLEGKSSAKNLRLKKVTWVVRTKGREKAAAVIHAVSEKGGRHVKSITLR